MRGVRISGVIPAEQEARACQMQPQNSGENMLSGSNHFMVQGVGLQGQRVNKILEVDNLTAFSR